MKQAAIPYLSTSRRGSERRPNQRQNVALGQQASIQRYSGAKELQLLDVIRDEFRFGKGNEILPNLRGALSKAAAEGSHVVVADISRLTPHLDLAAALKSLKAIESFGVTVHCANQWMTLDQMTSDLRAQALLNYDFQRKSKSTAIRFALKERANRPQKMDQRRLGKARASSVVSRKREADDFARQIASTIQQIWNNAGDRRLSLGSIAKELNERGIRSARGNLWSAMSVKRVLDRLEQN